MMNNVEASRILQPEHCAYWPGQASIHNKHRLSCSCCKYLPIKNLYHNAWCLGCRTREDIKKNESPGRNADSLLRFEMSLASYIISH